MNFSNLLATTFVSALVANFLDEVQNKPPWVPCYERFDKIYDDCYDKKHCFGFHPTNSERCVDKRDCTMMTTLAFYTTFDNASIMPSVDIQITGTYTDKSEYIAMAFSDTSTMGKDLVFACSWSWPFEEMCKPYWNENFGGKSERINDKPYPDSLFRYDCARFHDGRFSVMFQLENPVTVKGQKFNFEKGYYLLLASGLLKGDQIEKHTAKSISSVKFGIDGVIKGPFECKDKEYCEAARPDCRTSAARQDCKKYCGLCESSSCVNEESWCESTWPDCNSSLTRERCKKFCGLCGGTESSSTVTTFSDPKIQNTTNTKTRFSNSESKITTLAYSETLKVGTDEGVTNVDGSNEDATDFTTSAKDKESETKITALATNLIVTPLSFALTLVLFFFNA